MCKTLIMAWVPAWGSRRKTSHNQCLGHREKPLQNVSSFYSRLFALWACGFRFLPSFLQVSFHWFFPDAPRGVQWAVQNPRWNLRSIHGSNKTERSTLFLCVPNVHFHEFFRNVGRGQSFTTNRAHNSHNNKKERITHENKASLQKRKKKPCNKNNPKIIKKR